MSRKISLSLNLIDQSKLQIEAPDDMPLSDILPLILQRLGEDAGSLDQYIVFVARAVSLDQTLGEISVHSGDGLHIVKTDVMAASVKLQLFLPRQSGPWKEIRRTPAYLGRYDEELQDVPLDIDVTDILPADKKRAVSRRQALFTEHEGRWYVQLHENAKIPMFVNSQRVVPNQRVLLEQNDVLAVGASANQPDLQLIIHLES